MTIDLELAAKERGIKYYLISFTDLFGVPSSKLVPAAAIGEAVRVGVPFGGFATWLRGGSRAHRLYADRRRTCSMRCGISAVQPCFGRSSAGASSART
jgi:hypothetical protein